MMYLNYITGAGHTEETPENRSIMLALVAESFRHGAVLTVRDLSSMTAWEQEICKEAYQLVRLEHRQELMNDVVKMITDIMQGK